MKYPQLQKLFSEIPCKALLIENPTNLFYMLGFPISTGTLLVHPEGGCLIVDGRYFELCAKKSPFPVILQKENVLEKLLKEHPTITNLGFDSSSTSYARYQTLLETCNNIPLIPLDNPLKCLRKTKNSEEIQRLKQAGVLGSQGFDLVCSLLKEGVSEKEVAFELEMFWRKQGAEGVAFDPIIAFGPNSSMPHYRAGSTRLKKGDVVLIDIGVTLEHYHSDMTRTVFFGEPDPQLLTIYSIVQQAQCAAVKICAPGITLGELDGTARQIIQKAGYGDKFTHSLGHGIGIEVHEFPTIRNTPALQNIPLESGMVVTIEPGIYLPNVGGVRIEDTLLITDQGHENLTNRSTDLTYV